MRRTVLVPGLIVVFLTLSLYLLSLSVVAVPALAAPPPSVADRLTASQKAGRPVFLLVTEPRARGLEAVRAATLAAHKRAPHTAIIEMDRSEAANKPIVKRYGLAGARTPFVLVLAHNGAPGGGVMPGKDVEKKLLALLPSPRKAATLLAIFQRKAAFVVVGRPDMPGRAAALAACAKAVATLKGKGSVIEVDLRDKHEQTFLGVLGADAKATDVVVHVYGLTGLKTGIAKAGTNAAALVELAKKKAECCPTGKCG
jgi:hypothetical protein